MSKNQGRLEAEYAEGARERKRRETRERIAEAGQRLFLTNGYDGTTLDAIAAEAGISRRTFFSYFKSKDDVILFWRDAGSASLHADLLKTSPDVPPLEAVRDLMIKYVSAYTTEQMTAIDNLMHSSESLLARKQAHYAEQEHALFETLCEVWRQPERRSSLRMVAMLSIGVMRLALEAWREQVGERKPAASIMRNTFDSLRVELWGPKKIGS